ncbi:MAG: DUF2520 domain-containing protein [Myxococcota bacterium]|nr:DUF2520 domain-containing protein [Myxococcota bacterium]
MIDRQGRRAQVAVYGGAFDPPHFGHQSAILWLLGRFDEVWVLPTAEHAFGKNMVPFEERCRLLTLLLQPFEQSRLRISRVESERGLSKSFDTLSYLSGQHPSFDFHLVIGADNLSLAHRWHRFDELIARWPVVAFARAGHERALEEACEAGWCVAAPPLGHISSTQLRRALSEGAPDTQLCLSLPQPLIEPCRDLYQHTAQSTSDQPLATIWGPGRCGQVLAQAFTLAGWEVQLLSRESPITRANLESVVWLLATPEQTIYPLAKSIASFLSLSGGPKPAPPVLHCAGSRSLEVLSPLQERGVPTGTFHPLQSLRGPESAAALRGAYIGITGAPPAVEIAQRLATAIGARPLLLNETGPLYHSAATFAGNLSLISIAEGAAILSSLGLPDQEAAEASAALAQGAIKGWVQTPSSETLTGALARRDLQTVRAHVEALSDRPESLGAYQMLSQLGGRWLGWGSKAQAKLQRVLDPSEPAP